MKEDHAIKCTCGQVRGRLARQAKITRCLCYCKSCQAFARFLKRDHEILDSAGGTDIVQTLPAWVHIDQGMEHLACMRLSEKGIFRWYTSCCNTPIGNTAGTARLSFVGLIHNCLESEGENLDESFGPVTVVVNTESAIGSPRPGEKGKLAGLFSVLLRAFTARLNGKYRQTPFFDAGTNTPVVTPRILSRQEARDLQSQ